MYDTFSSRFLHVSPYDRLEYDCTLKPQCMFISGVGGAGESFLINVIWQFARLTWSSVSSVAAPTGLPSCNVGGITTYKLCSKTAFKSCDKIHHEKVFIIDKESMVSSENLAYIHLRLEEKFGGDCWFAGKLHYNISVTW